MTETIRVRFAPSPTGYLHVGGARTALFNYLLARQKGGRYILRMEDTDQERNTAAARQSIFDGLRWLGLSPDEGPEEGGDFGPYSQSERDAIYRGGIDELIARGALYPCFCSRERLESLRERQKQDKQSFGYDRLCRHLSKAEVDAKFAAGDIATWRLKVDETGETHLHDLVRGDITVPNADIEDIILVRGDGSPVYNLAVVIDDHTMEITHVLRGEDHLTNTFKQVLLYDTFGWTRPKFAHLPLILGDTGEGKLSKRKHPEAALEHYIERDYHPEGVVSWLALIGWSLDDKTDVMTRDELIQSFSIEKISKGGARLNLSKLASMSGHYIRLMDVEALAERLTPHLLRAGYVDATHSEAGRIRHLASVLRERLVAFSDVIEEARWVFEDLGELEPKALKNLQKGGENGALLRAYADALPAAFESPEALEAHARKFAEDRGDGFGKLVHPVRAAITGRAGGPPLFDCMVLVGKETAVQRLRAAADLADQPPTP